MSKFSIQSFLEEVANGNLRSKRHKIYEYLKDMGPMSLQSLRARLASKQIPHQTLTGQLSLLQDHGLIDQDKHGRFYVVSDTSDQIKVANRRLNEKKQKWLKQGETHGWINDVDVAA